MHKTFLEIITRNIYFKTSRLKKVNFNRDNLNCDNLRVNYKQVDNFQMLVQINLAFVWQ